MQKVDELIDRFRVIDKERMQGLPFYNPQLSVEGIDFQQIELGYVGALVTPWFINIILLYEKPPQTSTPQGNWLRHHFPSGEHEFMAGEDEQLGRYDFISLASPTSKYKSQQQACDFARKKLKNIVSADFDRGEEKPVKFMVVEDEKLSRRDFLGGK
ncbi:MAG: [NiFe]-hydrogenase assembly chaperone HybE [Gammaproteobacteria bacterium]